jgi:hypothetical protein
MGRKDSPTTASLRRCPDSGADDTKEGGKITQRLNDQIALLHLNPKITRLPELSMNLVWFGMVGW